MDVEQQAMAGAIALGITQVATQALKLPSRVAPLLALVIAVLVAVALSETRDARAVIAGIIAGLGSSGLYSGGKAMAGR